MKRFILLIVALSFALSVTASAISYDHYYYQNDDGSMGHDTEMYKRDLAQEMVTEKGLNLIVDNYWIPDPHASELTYIFDFESFQNDYNALVATMPPVEAPTEPPTEPPTEAPTEAPTEVPTEEPMVNEEIFDIENNDDTLLENVLEVPENNFSDMGINSNLMYSVNDLRAPVSSDIEPLGLKAVIRSIFGEYTPNMTTTTVTETVDGEVVTTLIDVVASGSAGVDWEYISGVLIFAIMLFCLFKLLGGIIT